MLNVNAQQLDNVSNLFRRLWCVTHQVLKCWATTLTGVWDFGSVMEVFVVNIPKTAALSIFHIQIITNRTNHSLTTYAHFIFITTLCSHSLMAHTRSHIDTMVNISPNRARTCPGSTHTEDWSRPWSKRFGCRDGSSSPLRSECTGIGALTRPHASLDWHNTEFGNIRSYAENQISMVSFQSVLLSFWSNTSNHTHYYQSTYTCIHREPMSSPFQPSFLVFTEIMWPMIDACSNISSYHSISIHMYVATEQDLDLHSLTCLVDCEAY
jgi:hypothetical protein